MIATLTGRVTDKLSNSSIVLDVKGVGYGLLVPGAELNRFVVGEEYKLNIYEHIRENSFDLYGFLDTDTKHLFVQLLDVSGVGPKGALAILGVGSSQAIKQAIASGDVKLIQSASGVGKKVAERVVVELKDKVGLVSSDNAEKVLMSDAMASQDEAVQALLALGYGLSDALVALSKVDKSLRTADRVKKALGEIN
jgi:holliday junction DNA helicase RuvA